MELVSLVVLVSIALIHLMMASVLALYSRYKVQYLSLAWIMGIFGAMSCLAIPCYSLLKFENIGLLHPFMLLALVVTSYLQTIYPLSISMPGYLQWGRMVRYASPAILLIILYTCNLLGGNRPALIYSYRELARCWLTWEMLFRLAAFALSLYYVVNLLRLPRQLAPQTDVPRYVKGYATAVGLNTLHYMILAATFNVTLFYVYYICFTVLNMYLFYRTLETMAMHLPKPEIVAVDEVPSEEVAVPADRADFNKENRRRFERVEYFMQHEQEWRDSTFGRDRLCEMTGVNRHLLLQCLRSQGYNNCHEYINSYRLNALKRGVRDGSLQAVNDCVVVGFGTAKTARACFEKSEGYALDDFFREHAR